MILPYESINEGENSNNINEIYQRILQLEKDRINIQISPNPFNDETRLQFNVPKREYVILAVYNLNGQLIRTLMKGQLDKGNYEVK